MCIQECVYACNKNNQRDPEFKKKEQKAGRVGGRGIWEWGSCKAHIPSSQRKLKN